MRVAHLTMQSIAQSQVNCSFPRVYWGYTQDWARVPLWSQKALLLSFPPPFPSTHLGFSDYWRVEFVSGRDEKLLGCQDDRAQKVFQLE